MKNIIVALVMAVFFLGCANEESVAVESKSVVGASLAGLALNDQHGASHALSADTKRVVFAFSKEMGHLSNDFFNKQAPAFLAEHDAVFIADVSSAPSLIRSMFIMPGLQDFKHTVLVIEDESTAASYRIDADSEKLMVLDVDNFIIKDIRFIATEEELLNAL